MLDLEEMPLTGDESGQIRRYCALVNASNIAKNFYQIVVILTQRIVFPEEFGPWDHKSQFNINFFLTLVTEPNCGETF